MGDNARTGQRVVGCGDDEITVECFKQTCGALNDNGRRLIVPFATVAS